MTPYWLWFAGFWCGFGCVITALTVTAIYLDGKETESRFSLLWGFYKRDMTDARRYSSWLWGAFVFARPKLACEKAAEPVPPQGGSGLVRPRVTGHFTSFVGMQDLRDLFSGRITAAEYSKKKGPLFVSGPLTTADMHTPLSEGWVDDEEDTDDEPEA